MHQGQSQARVQQLRQWMLSKGCLIHPSVQIPSRINGVQGIATNCPISHSTLIIAIPSSLILTTQRCYNDPKLRRLFLKNDDLFDYQASQDNQFNVICVFLMYHKLHIQQSEWKTYLNSIAQPQTAIDWSGVQLKGLNRSLVEEIVHVRKQCDILQQQITQYLLSRKEFAGTNKQQLSQLFNYCYRAVMTRCFGYYFGQSSLIPIADLINHSCQVVNHQLINTRFEKGQEMHESYNPVRDKIDCSLLRLPTPNKCKLPFRQRFLVDKQLIKQDQQQAQRLTRIRIDSLIDGWNEERFRKGQEVQALQFCDQDDSEDNDTDQEMVYDKSKELQMCRQNEAQQMQQFMKYYVTIEKYEDVQKQLAKLQGNSNQSTQQAKQSTKSEKKQQDRENAQENDKNIYFSRKMVQNEQKQKAVVKDQQQNQEQWQDIDQNNKQQPKTQKKQQKPTKKKQQLQRNPFAAHAGRGVPIQMVESSSEQESGTSEWGLQQGSYFTMSTSSAVPASTQLYNSYGSRTNKFLLIWYGFAYPNNLYDSVSFRMQVQFGSSLRKAEQIVLDSYVGGQGRSFRKPNMQLVKETQISSEFRLKATKINTKLVYFLRLYLLHYYKGKDLYKVLVTFPASISYEIYVFQFYRDILTSLYNRYPLEAIDELRKEKEMKQFQGIRHKIGFKLVYLQQQRKILDRQIGAVNTILDILQKCKNNSNVLTKDMYGSLSIGDVKMVRQYLITLKKYSYYMQYQQDQTYQKDSRDQLNDKQAKQQNTSEKQQ